MNDALMLSPKQAAAALGVSERKLWAMTFEADEKTESLPYVKAGRLVRYPVDDLRAWIAKQTRTGGAN
jgi:excisionase family DNA binding protein